MRPPLLRPMLARLGRLPSGDGWAYEPKWDGFRGLCFIAGASVRLVSRRGNDLTRLCPAVSSLAALEETVLDGELVAFRDGQPSFEALQGVMRYGAAADVAFLVFDLLWHRGRSVLDQPYDQRRGVLESLALAEPVYVSRRFEDGKVLFEQTREQGYEGVVAKRRASRYRCGERNGSWIKVKHWREGEYIIGGWSPPCNNHGWGLLVGEHDDAGDLLFRGRVELGITPTDREHLERVLVPLTRETSPFATFELHPRRFTEPVLTAEIRYLEQTSAGLLRHATFRQLGGRWNQ